MFRYIYNSNRNTAPINHPGLIKKKATCAALNGYTIIKPLLSTRAKTIEVNSSLRNNPYCDLLQVIKIINHFIYEKNIRT